MLLGHQPATLVLLVQIGYRLIFFHAFWIFEKLIFRASISSFDHHLSKKIQLFLEGMILLIIWIHCLLIFPCGVLLAKLSWSVDWLALMFYTRKRTKVKREERNSKKKEIKWQVAYVPICLLSVHLFVLISSVFLSCLREESQLQRGNKYLRNIQTGKRHLAGHVKFSYMTGQWTSRRNKTAICSKGLVKGEGGGDKNVEVL